MADGHTGHERILDSLDKKEKHILLSLSRYFSEAKGRDSSLVVRKLMHQLENDKTPFFSDDIRALADNPVACEFFAQATNKAHRQALKDHPVAAIGIPIHDISPERAGQILKNCASLFNDVLLDND